MTCRLIPCRGSNLPFAFAMLWFLYRPHSASILQACCISLQIQLQTGELLDTFTISDDFVHLSHNGGIHLYDDVLVVLAVSPLLYQAACSMWFLHPGGSHSLIHLAERAPPFATLPAEVAFSIQKVVLSLPYARQCQEQ